MKPRYNNYINAAICSYFIRYPLYTRLKGPPGLEGSPGINRVSNASGGRTDRLLPANISLFYLIYYSKFVNTVPGIKYSSKNISLRDIYIFIS